MPAVHTHRPVPGAGDLVQIQNGRHVFPRRRAVCSAELRVCWEALKISTRTGRGGTARGRERHAEGVWREREGEREIERE